MALANKTKKVEGEPQESHSILRKANSLGIPSTLVIGGAGTGKSTLVRNLLLKGGKNPLFGAGKNPLWLPFNNAGALTDERVANWDTAVPSSWKDFQDGVFKPALAGELIGYDAIVIDGLNILMGYALTAQAPSGITEQSDWLKASNNVRDVLVKLRDKFQELYAIVDVVVEAKSGGRKIDLNPYTKNVLVPLFGQKFYTHIVKERGEGNKLTGNLQYTVQRNPALALDFTPGEVIELD